MNLPISSSPYDAEFFRDQVSGSARSAQTIVPLIIDQLQPRSVVDVGCGTGAWLKEFQDRGVKDILGIDGPHMNAEQLRIDEESFLSLDLATPSKPELSKFSLAMSLEVAEHLPAARADGFVDLLTHLSDVVVFSAAIPFQAGVHHINEQWQGYWCRKFEDRGYVFIDWLRSRIWSDAQVLPWYKQNIMTFVHEKQLQVSEPLQELQRRAQSPASIAHPDVFENHADPDLTDLRRIGLKRILHALPGLVVNSISGRFGSSA